MKKTHNRSLNVLLLIGWRLGQGGHINSTLALSKPLIGAHKINKIYLLAPKGEKVKYFKDANIKYIQLPNPSSLLLFRLIGFFFIIYYSLIYRIHIIHAMDYKCLVPSVMSNLFLRRVLVFTKAGGQPLKISLPALSHLIVFSKELLDYYNSNYRYNDKITLIKERLDFDEFKDVKISKIEDNSLSIFIAMRLSPAKEILLESFFEEFKHFVNKKHKINVVIAGDGELKEKCEKKSREISKQNDTIKFKYLGQINNKEEIYRYYRSCDITAGHGRGIMEAMAIGKPVVLLGFDKKTSVLVSECNVKQIADYNFSGRNIKYAEDSISLAEIINSANRKEILQNSGEFSLDYITRHYSSKIGASKLTSIYHNAKRPNFKDFWRNLKWILQRFLGR